MRNISFFFKWRINRVHRDKLVLGNDIFFSSGGDTNVRTFPGRVICALHVVSCSVLRIFFQPCEIYNTRRFKQRGFFVQNSRKKKPNPEVCVSGATSSCISTNTSQSLVDLHSTAGSNFQELNIAQNVAIGIGIGGVVGTCAHDVFFCPGLWSSRLPKFGSRQPHRC
jgi:hypothetical protein